MESNNIGWYAIYTSSKAEYKVKKRLDEAGVENFLPLQTVTRLWNKRRKKLMIPVVPGHIFVRIPEEEILKVATIQGVSFLLQEERKYVVIPETQMRTFQYMLESTDDLVEFAPAGLLPGKNVRIVHGQLQNIPGELIERQQKNKLIVRIDGLGCALLTLPASYIVKE